MSEQPNTREAGLDEIRQMLDKHIEALYALTGGLDKSKAPNGDIHDRVSTLRQWWILYTGLPEVLDSLSRESGDQAARTITVMVGDVYEMHKKNFLNYLDYTAGESHKPLSDDLSYYDFLFGLLYHCPDPIPDKYSELITGVSIGDTYGDVVDNLLRLQEKSRDY